MTYTFTGNYKARFNEEVTKLIENNDAGRFVDRTDKMAEVQRLIDAYISQISEVPEMSELERLTDAILSEELKSMDTWKAKNKEYPFFSERQLERRQAEEVSFKRAEEIGANGKSYAPPSRRKRSAYENGYVDRQAKIRNNERRKQYRMDTAPGPVEVCQWSPEETSTYLEEAYGYRHV